MKLFVGGWGEWMNPLFQPLPHQKSLILYTVNLIVGGWGVVK